MSHKTPVEETYSWFDPLYARAEGDASQVPWALSGPAPSLVDWLKKNKSNGRSAVVVGCGLGDDAEALAANGFEVTAFDVAESAIAWAQKRFPHSPVTYTAADLFNLPTRWQNSFDLVFEFRTLQALPLDVRTTAIEQVASLAKPNGTVLVTTYTRGNEGEIPDGPPWPLSESELAHFEQLGLAVEQRQHFRVKGSRFGDRAQIQYKKSQ